MLLPWLTPMWPPGTGPDEETLYYPSETDHTADEIVIRGSGNRYHYLGQEGSSDATYRVLPTRRGIP